MNSNQFNKILVVKHGSLGDIAFSILAMASIKQFFSNATIDLLTEEKYVKFLSNSNYFNSIFDSSNGLVEVIDFLKKGNFKNKSIPQSGLKRSYTTPSLLSFIKIYRNWKKMKR